MRSCIVGLLLLVVRLARAAWPADGHRRSPSACSSTLTAVLADVFLIEPMTDDAVQWRGSGWTRSSGRSTLLGAWLVPAMVLLAVLALRGRLVRSPFRAATDGRGALVEMLRDGDAGTLGHMGTWRGNATWTHPDGRRGRGVPRLRGRGTHRVGPGVQR